MVSDPVFAWALTVCFATVGVVWLVALTGAQRRIDRGSFFAHVLMSASMAIMPWAWSMAVPALLQIVVFTVAALWYAGLLVLRHAGAHTGHHDGPVFLGYHAAMMTAMVWMSALMALMAGGDPAGPASAHAHGMSMPGMNMPGMPTTTPGLDAATGLWQQPLWAIVITLAFVAMFLVAAVCMLVALVRGRSPAAPGPLSPVTQTLLNLVMAIGMGGSFLVLT